MAYDKLLEHLIKIKNESGSLKTAPQSLKNLESSLDKVPSQLDIPGMSGLLSSGNMINGIMGFMKQLGGFQDLGNIGQIISKVSSQAGAGGGQVNTQTMVDAAASVVTPEELIAKLGDFNSLATALFSEG